MPHCSLEFSRIGLLVAVHSQWNEQQTLCALRIFTDRQRAQDFLATIPASERQGFAPCAAVLENNTDGLGALELYGDIALSLTAFLVKLRWEAQVLTRVINRPDFMGFWEPPAVRASGSGMIMWFHQNDGYRVMIAACKRSGGECDARIIMAWAPTTTTAPRTNQGMENARSILGCFAENHRSYRRSHLQSITRYKSKRRGTRTQGGDAKLMPLSPIDLQWQHCRFFSLNKCALRGSNPRPTVCKTVALPLS